MDLQIMPQLDIYSWTRKWINGALFYEAYSSFEEVTSNQRIVSAKICWVYAEMKNKQSAPHITTGLHLTIEVYVINMRSQQETNSLLFRRYMKHILRMTNMEISSQLTWKQL